MSTVLKREQHGDVLSLIINRPKVRNAIDEALRGALRESFAAAAKDNTVRAIVLSGADGHFCAGGDISTMRDMSVESGTARLNEARDTVLTIAACPKPVIAAVCGHAAGAGVGLAIICDEVIADPRAQFTISFSRIGLAVDWGLSATLPARVGAARARRMAVDANRVDASSALSIGLVDELSDSGKVLETALARAQALSLRAAPALAGIKKHFRIDPTRLRDALDRERDIQLACFDSAEFVEGTRAFREKREPDFRAAARGGGR